MITSSNGSHIQVYCEMGQVCGGGRRGWTRAIHQQYYNWINIPSNSCETYNSFVNFGIKYDHLCVQLQGSLHDYNRQCAPFYPEVSIDKPYVRGISITHGSLRQHILSLSNGCEDVDEDEYSIPEFIGYNYFLQNCDYSLNTCYYHISSVTTNLKYTTTDDVEVRICSGIRHNHFYSTDYYIVKFILLLR